MIVCKVNTLTIEDLADELELLYWTDGIYKYQICENFNYVYHNVYQVKRLGIDIDNDFICFYDRDNEIQQKSSVLMCFIRDCLKDIHKVINGFELEFIDGIVTIKNRLQ